MVQKLTRLIPILLATIIMCASSWTVISYAAESYKSATELESQGTSTNNENVEVDVYYAGGKHTNTIDITETEAKIYVKVQVKNAGYLENAKIDLSDCNFEIADDEANAGKIKTIDTDNKIVELNKIVAGNEVEIALKITPIKEDRVSPGIFKKDNKVTIKGTYINENTKEKEITKEIVIHTSWHGEATAKVNQEIVKYVPYTVAGKTEALMQTEVTTEIENSIIPVKQTEVEVSVPTIMGIKPEKVMVYAKTTESTNGESGAISFNNTNYSYDESEGKVTITVKNNEGTDGKISWVKGAQDKYEIIMIYPEEVVEAVGGESTAIIELSASIENTYYNDVESTGIGGKTSREAIVEKGNIVDFEVGIEEEAIAKGYMYNGVETTYTEKYTMSTSNAEITEEMVITQNVSNIVKESGEESSGVNCIYNKKIKVRKAEIEKILGESGKIEIISNSNVIATIDNTKEANSEGIIEVDIAEAKASNIEIRTSKPQTEGLITIEVEKGISGEAEYSVEDKNIKTTAECKAMSGEEEITKVSLEDTMRLEEPTEKATISINKENLSTVVSNDVEITALLETDSADDSLYTNPTVTIKLPSYISNVNVRKTEVLYSDELIIKESILVDGENGKEIQIKLEGTQTKYNDNVTKGTKILIYADIEVNKTTPTTTSNIEMVYTNNVDSGTGNIDLVTKSVSVGVNFSAPTGLVAVNSYSMGETNISVVDDEKGIITLDVFGESKTANLKGEIINNYSNTISGVTILGRIPTQESIKFDSSEKVGNTFDLTLKGPIVVSGLDSGYTVYYSENAGASKDLSDTNNSWTTEVTDYSKIKSYLITIDGELGKAVGVSWNYNLNIPANLEYKNNVKSNYKVYLQNNAESGIVNESKESPEISLETEKGPELEATVTSLDVANGGTVTIGKQIEFKVTVKNTGSETISGVKVELPIPNNVQYDDSDANNSFNETNNCVETSLGDILSGESKVATIRFDLNEVGDTTIRANITATGFTGYIQSNEYNFIIEDTDIALVNRTIYDEVKVSKGDEVDFSLQIKNLKNEEVNDLVIEYVLPKGLNFVEYKVLETLNEEVTYDEDKNVISIKIPTLEANTNIGIFIYTIVTEENEGMETIARATFNGKTYTSNIAKINVNTSGYNVVAVNPGEQYIKTGDNIVSTFTIKNEGEAILYDLKFKYAVPEETEFIEAELQLSNTNYEITNDNGSIIFTMPPLGPGEEATFIINLKVILEATKDEQEIKSYLDLEHDKFGNKTSETLVYIMKAQEEESPENNIEGNNENNEIIDPGDEDKQGYEINGKIWIDVNKNGKYDEGEESVSEVTVILINKNTGDVQLTTVTNENGRYILDELESGEYLVGFLYDSNKYVITEYQKEGVSKTSNSDAIKSMINYNGEDRTVGLTDTLKITDEDINNIDLGIYEAEVFDLSLEKYVSKVTVNNTSGITTYDYNGENKTLVKVDIPAKYMSSSTVIIEYKIVVKNEGDIAGYAKKIVDYLPEDLKFSTELNPGAYLGKDGNIYSEELADTIINPGESKEITLILTKKMTEANTGTVVNEAEIAESYNELGLNDINSEAGNKDEKENDLGSANAIITVKTGQVVIYTALIITVIAILCVGTYLIRKFILND